MAAAWADNPSALSDRSVRQLLDTRPSLVGADATVGDVARRMHTDAVDAVVVIDRTGCPVGMITGGDLIALMARTVPSTTSPNSEDDSGRLDGKYDVAVHEDAAS